METFNFLDLPPEIIEKIANDGNSLELFLHLRGTSNRMIDTFRLLRFNSMVKYDRVKKLTKSPRFDRINLEKPPKKMGKLIRMNPKYLYVKFNMVKYRKRVFRVPKSVISLTAVKCSLYIDPIRNSGLRRLGLDRVILSGLVTDRLINLTFDYPVYPLKNFMGFSNIIYFRIFYCFASGKSMNTKNRRLCSKNLYPVTLDFLSRMSKLRDLVMSIKSYRLFQTRYKIPNIPTLNTLELYSPRRRIVKIDLDNNPNIVYLSLHINEYTRVLNPPINLDRYKLIFNASHYNPDTIYGMNISAREVYIHSNVNFKYNCTGNIKKLTLIGKVLAILNDTIIEMRVCGSDRFTLVDPKNITKLVVTDTDYISLRSLGIIKYLELDSLIKLEISPDSTWHYQVDWKEFEKAHMVPDLLESVRLSGQNIIANIFGRLKNVKRTYSEDNKLIYLEYDK